MKDYSKKSYFHIHGVPLGSAVGPIFHAVMLVFLSFPKQYLLILSFAYTGDGFWTTITIIVILIFILIRGLHQREIHIWEVSP